MKRAIWILVADASQARLFWTDGSQTPLVELKDFLHIEGRSKISDLVSDQPGKHSGTGATGTHGMENKQDIKEQERDVFAREICTHLQKSHEQKQFQRLYLVAPSHMLGALNKHLDKGTRDTIQEEFDLLLVKASPDEIRGHLPQYL